MHGATCLLCSREGYQNEDTSFNQNDIKVSVVLYMTL